MSESQNQQAESRVPPGRSGYERPLTDAEIREIREIMEADRRVKWFWSTARRVAIWVGAVSGALMVMWESLVKAIRHLAGL